MRRRLRTLYAPDACPSKDEHTPCPTGYLAWQAWAERMSQTHRQIRHAACGLFTIWVRGGDE